MTSALGREVPQAVENCLSTRPPGGRRTSGVLLSPFPVGNGDREEVHSLFMARGKGVPTFHRSPFLHCGERTGSHWDPCREAFRPDLRVTRTGTGIPWTKETSGGQEQSPESPEGSQSGGTTRGDETLSGGGSDLPFWASHCYYGTLDTQERLGNGVLDPKTFSLFSGAKGLPYPSIRLLCVCL